MANTPQTAETSEAKDDLREIQMSANTLSDLVGEKLVIGYPSADEPVIDPADA